MELTVYWGHWKPHVVFRLFVWGLIHAAHTHISSIRNTCHLEISAHYREVSIDVENRIQVLIEETTMEHSKTLSIIKCHAMVRSFFKS